MIPKKPAPHLMRGGYRFPACAKPLHGSSSGLKLRRGEGRSEKIMLMNNIERDDDSKKSHPALMVERGDIPRPARSDKDERAPKVIGTGRG
jgi:hypothetical protein